MEDLGNPRHTLQVMRKLAIGTSKEALAFSIEFENLVIAAHAYQDRFGARQMIFFLSAWLAGYQEVCHVDP